MRPFKLNVIKNLILDMDGVLWRGQTPMPGLPDFFETLESLGIGYVLATNNATKVAAQYTERLAGYGVNVEPGRILSSSEATAGYLSDEYPAGASVYVVGEGGLRSALQSCGFELMQSDGFIGEGARADLVIVGMTRHACYLDFASAAYLINNGARFVGTNPDVTIPTEVGPLPGAGSLLSLLRTATGVEPTIVGKPGRAIFEEALARLEGTPEQTAMVGDRLETDIAGAQAAGVHTVLLLSGVTDREQLEESKIRPDLVCEDIGELRNALLARA